MAEKEAAKQAKIAEKKAEKKNKKENKDDNIKRGRPKKEHVVVASGDYTESVKAQQVDLIEQLKSEPDNEEEIQATLFEFDGTIYYKSDDHVLYDKENHDEVGVWDPVENEIIFKK